MTLYGCARASPLDPDLSLQQAALKAAGCVVIRAEAASGTRRDGRTELEALLESLLEQVFGSTADTGLRMQVQGDLWEARQRADKIKVNKRFIESLP